jgi:hypothetical protein
MTTLMRVAAVLAAAAIATPAFACGLMHESADVKAEQTTMAQAPQSDATKAQPKKDQKADEDRKTASAVEKDRKVAQK